MTSTTEISSPQWRHWRLEREADGLAWLTIDRADSAVNALSAEVMTELAQVLDSLQSAPPTGLIIRSGKAAGFIAGADVEEFVGLDTPQQAHALVERGWQLFNRLASVPYPTLALIQGHCLGGGLELALACRYRLAVDVPGTSLALPEVMLGIFPGWGGMRRLPALIGPAAALDMMLTGRPADARKAAALGLVDARVPPRLSDTTARRHVLSGKPAHRARGIAAWMNHAPFKSLVAKRAQKQVEAKDPQGHYPAAPAIITLWSQYDGNALAAPQVIDRILTSDTARNLLRVFRLQERLKSCGKAREGISPVQHVHVVGAGTMGGDIAAWCALKGMTVTLQDQDAARIAPAIGRATALYARKLKDPYAARAAADRLVPDPAGDGVTRADLVIEAITEQVEAKQALYRAVESRMKPDAILATNTSSLSLATLRTGLTQPHRLIGIHFFNPVAQMPLVEVVQAGPDEQGIQARACAFVGQLGKLPLPVSDAPGFLVNAVLAPYMLAAMRQVDDGVSPETIDRAMTDFGMPMGPLELADTVGLDIALAAGQQLTQQAKPPRCLADRISRGDLGRKSGQGFYAWHDGKARKQQPATPPAGMAEKLIAPLIERTQQQVDKGVVADADLADAGVIFGTGFAPFTGGPLHYRNNKLHNTSTT
ncbi:3-hydroxyacyl-CoA dehydrogenase NAD-binding domain-containing protein [Bordetella genomosp. 4]|uniref:Enoyl-CoA hydratase n=1 Tax=Bordetella genomosp. 4 TaxID=463044 RepID=A0A261TZN6_9BORD|nr:3-hydroxyacyl-CoA dehydrogenase NAD-binding domain-containing protein [Bordetella genomosp. 4]OZI54450.1 enoyl-CoA hydratase [Bordetella genomosp. 4]